MKEITNENLTKKRVVYNQYLIPKILQEYEIDKKLGITGPADVQKLGIKAYNDECRKIVMRYSEEWEVRAG